MSAVEQTALGAVQWRLANRQRAQLYGWFATLYAAIRADMLDAPYMRDFLLTAKDTSFSTLDGVSAVR